MRVAVGWLLLSGCDLIFTLRDPPPVVADATLDAAPLECPPSYVDIGGGKYSFHAGPPVSWAGANALCKNEQTGSGFTHLAVVSNDLEQALIVASGMLPTNTTSWIGLSDLAAEGNYEWITNEPIVPRYPGMDGQPPWSLGEPNNQSEEDCVNMEPGAGAFNDIGCIMTRAYVCECDAFESRL